MRCDKAIQIATIFLVKALLVGVGGIYLDDTQASHSFLVLGSSANSIQDCA